jgi:hypothetical protein
MRLEGDNSFLELDRSELGPPGTPGDRDVLFNITANVSGYTAADQAWVAELDLDRFVEELRDLEACREGEAVLMGASPDDLRLEFQSTDSIGHMAVRGHVGWNHPSGFLLQLRFGFNFEPDLLPRLLQYFETIREQTT